MGFHGAGTHCNCQANPVDIAKAALSSAWNSKDTHDNCQGNEKVPSVPMGSQESLMGSD